MRAATQRSGRAWEVVLGGGLLPGVLAGALVAGLLFYIDPRLPFSAPVVGRALAAYGGLLGAVSLAAHLPWTWGRPQRAARAVPWTVFAVLAAFALLDWTHASHFAYYLPPGINARLFKAGFWLLGCALACFYVALLHSLHGRAYGWRARGVVAVAVVAAIGAQLERREAFREPRRASPRQSMVESAARPRLCVVAIETATLDAILPLAGQGRLPFFRHALERGTAARLATLTPTRRPALWASLSTGKYPYRHGLVSSHVYRASFLGAGQELRILPRGMGFSSWGTLTRHVRRVDGRELRVLPFWDALSRLGFRTGVVGWPQTSPVSAEPAFVVSDRFFAAADPPPTGSIRPLELADRSRPLREAMAGFDVTGFESVPEGIKRAMAGDVWRAGLARLLVEADPDLEAVIVFLPALASVSRQYFGGFVEIQFEGATGEAELRAAQIVSNYYSRLDEMVGSLWRTQRFDLLAIVSAHGVEAPTGWARVQAQVSQDLLIRGRMDNGPDGVLIMLGRGVRPGFRVPEARIEDVVPTIIYGSGFPVASDLDGEVLVDAFEPEFVARNPIDFVPSYETLAPRQPSPPLPAN